MLKGVKQTTNDSDQFDDFPAAYWYVIWFILLCSQKYSWAPALLTSVFELLQFLSEGSKYLVTFMTMLPINFNGSYQCCGSALIWCRSGSEFPFWCLYMCFELIMIRIRLNDAYPTRSWSGSTTQIRMPCSWPYEHSSVVLYLGRIAERARLGGGGLRHRVPGQQARPVRVQPQTCCPGSSPGRHTKQSPAPTVPYIYVTQLGIYCEGLLMKNSPNLS